MHPSLKHGLLALVFHGLRALEFVLPVRLFHAVVRPVAELLPTPDAFRPDQPWPAHLGPEQRIRTALAFIHRLPAFFPERLATPKWAARCRIHGLESVQEARRAGRPVILAFCHFGPMVLMPLWLRAHGIPASILISGIQPGQFPFKDLKNAVNLFPEVPMSIPTDQLRGAIQRLSQTVLFVALDVRAGKLIQVPIAPDTSFLLATGAIRLAAQCDAVLIPCALMEEGPFRFRMELGRPVPQDLLREGPDLMGAGQHLLDELLPWFRKHPEQCFRNLLNSIRATTPDPIPAQPSK